MAAAVTAVEGAGRADLSGIRLRLAWVGYVTLGSFLLAVYVPGIGAVVSGNRAIFPDPIGIWNVAVAFLDTAIHVTVAAFILWRRPRDPVAIFTSFALMSVGLIHSSHFGLFGPQDSLTLFVLFLVIGNGGVLLLPFLFPDGRFVPRWGLWYWVVTTLVMQTIPFMVVPAAAGAIDLYAIELALVGGVIAQVLRYRHHSTPLQRLQTKWFLFGYLTFVVIWELNIRFANYIFFQVLRAPGPDPDSARLTFLLITSAAQHAAGVVVPVAILIATLRWRLFTIDLVINRTLVYAALTVVLVAVVAAASALLQPLLAGVIGGPTIANVATGGLVVGAFLPLRRSLQTLADRFVPERALLTLFFTDLVRSSDTLVAVGDERWRDLLDGFRSVVRREIARHKGREIDNAGDGFFATFRSPAQALRAATSIRDGVAALGLATRIGVHAGECEVHGRKVSGINVYTAARVMAAAGPGEVLVSSTVRDLVAGSQAAFVDRGMHQLKGLPDERRLFAVLKP